MMFLNTGNSSDGKGGSAAVAADDIMNRLRGSADSDVVSSNNNHTTPKMLHALFHESLEQILLEAVKNPRTMSVLRDAVHMTRVRQYRVMDLFATFVLACRLFGLSLQQKQQQQQLMRYSLEHSSARNPMAGAANDNRKNKMATKASQASRRRNSSMANYSSRRSTDNDTARQLLLQSLINLTRLTAIGALSHTLAVAEVICDLICRLAFVQSITREQRRSYIEDVHAAVAQTDGDGSSRWSSNATMSRTALDSSDAKGGVGDTRAGEVGKQTESLTSSLLCVPNELDDRSSSHDKVNGRIHPCHTHHGNSSCDNSCSFSSSSSTIHRGSKDVHDNNSNRLIRSVDAAGVRDRGSGMGIATYTDAESCGLQLIDDDAWLIHLLQLLTAVIAAWPLTSPALSPLLCTLFLLYTTTPAGSVAEVTCQATLTQCTQTFTATLTRAPLPHGIRNPNSEHTASPTAAEMNDATAVNTQLHAISYFRDLCRIAAGKTPHWLRVPLCMMELVGLPVGDATTPSSSRHAQDNRSDGMNCNDAANPLRVTAVAAHAHHPGRAPMEDAPAETPQPPWHPVYTPSLASPTISFSELHMFHRAGNQAGRTSSGAAAAAAAITDVHSGSRPGRAHDTNTAATTSSVTFWRVCSAVLSSHRVRLFLYSILTDFFRDRCRHGVSCGREGGGGCDDVHACMHTPMFAQSVNEEIIATAIHACRDWIALSYAADADADAGADGSAMEGMGMNDGGREEREDSAEDVGRLDRAQAAGARHLGDSRAATHSIDNRSADDGSGSGSGNGTNTRHRLLEPSDATNLDTPLCAADASKSSAHDRHGVHDTSPKQPWHPDDEDMAEEGKEDEDEEDEDEDGKEDGTVQPPIQQHEEYLQLFMRRTELAILAVCTFMPALRNSAQRLCTQHAVMIRQVRMRGHRRPSGQAMDGLLHAVSLTLRLWTRALAHTQCPQRANNVVHDSADCAMSETACHGHTLRDLLSVTSDATDNFDTAAAAEARVRACMAGHVGGRSNDKNHSHVGAGHTTRHASDTAAAAFAISDDLLCTYAENLEHEYHNNAAAAATTTTTPSALRNHRRTHLWQLLHELTPLHAHSVGTHDLPSNSPPHVAPPPTTCSSSSTYASSCAVSWPFVAMIEQAVWLLLEQSRVLMSEAGAVAYSSSTMQNNKTRAAVLLSTQARVSSPSPSPSLHRRESEDKRSVVAVREYTQTCGAFLQAVSSELCHLSLTLIGETSAPTASSASMPPNSASCMSSPSSPSLPAPIARTTAAIAAGTAAAAAAAAAATTIASSLTCNSRISTCAELRRVVAALHRCYLPCVEMVTMRSCTGVVDEEKTTRIMITERLPDTCVRAIMQSAQACIRTCHALSMSEARDDYLRLLRDAFFAPDCALSLLCAQQDPCWTWSRMPSKHSRSEDGARNAMDKSAVSATADCLAASLRDAQSVGSGGDAGGTKHAAVTDGQDGSNSSSSSSSTVSRTGKSPLLLRKLGTNISANMHRISTSMNEVFARRSAQPAASAGVACGAAVHEDSAAGVGSTNTRNSVVGRAPAGLDVSRCRHPPDCSPGEAEEGMAAAVSSSTSTRIRASSLDSVTVNMSKVYDFAGFEQRLLIVHTLIDLIVCEQEPCTTRRTEKNNLHTKSHYRDHTSDSDVHRRANDAEDDGQSTPQTLLGLGVSWVYITDCLAWLDCLAARLQRAAQWCHLTCDLTAVYRTSSTSSTTVLAESLPMREQSQRLCQRAAGMNQKAAASAPASASRGHRVEATSAESPQSVVNALTEALQHARHRLPCAIMHRILSSTSTHGAREAEGFVEAWVYSTQRLSHVMQKVHWTGVRLTRSAVSPSRVASTSHAAHSTPEEYSDGCCSPCGCRGDTHSDGTSDGDSHGRRGSRILPTHSPCAMSSRRCPCAVDEWRTTWQHQPPQPPPQQQQQPHGNCAHSAEEGYFYRYLVYVGEVELILWVGCATGLVHQWRLLADTLTLSVMMMMMHTRAAAAQPVATASATTCPTTTPAAEQRAKDEGGEGEGSNEPDDDEHRTGWVAEWLWRILVPYVLWVTCPSRVVQWGHLLCDGHALLHPINTVTDDNHTTNNNNNTTNNNDNNNNNNNNNIMYSMNTKSNSRVGSSRSSRNSSGPVVSSHITHRATRHPPGSHATAPAMASSSFSSASAVLSVMDDTLTAMVESVALLTVWGHIHPAPHAPSRPTMDTGSNGTDALRAVQRAAAERPLGSMALMTQLDAWLSSEYGGRRCRGCRVDVAEEPFSLLGQVYGRLVCTTCTATAHHSPNANRTHHSDNTRTHADLNGIDQAVHDNAVTQLLHRLRLTAVRLTLQLVHGYGEDIRGRWWIPILHVIESCAIHEPSPEVVSLAFRALEAVQHNCVLNVDAEDTQTSVLSTQSPPGSSPRGQTRPAGGGGACAAPWWWWHRRSGAETAMEVLVHCTGAFVCHGNAQPVTSHAAAAAGTGSSATTGTAAMPRVHVNLSAIQMLWSLADYMACSHDDMHGRSSGDTRRPVGREAEWCAVLRQLARGGCDGRHDVRQGSLKTLFALVQPHGVHFTAATWHCLLAEVLMPMMRALMRVAAERSDDNTVDEPAQTGLPRNDTGRQGPRPCDAPAESVLGHSGVSGSSVGTGSVSAAAAAAAAVASSAASPSSPPALCASVHLRYLTQLSGLSREDDAALWAVGMDWGHNRSRPLAVPTTHDAMCGSSLPSCRVGDVCHYCARSDTTDGTVLPMATARVEEEEEEEKEQSRGDGVAARMGRALWAETAAALDETRTTVMEAAGRFFLSYYPLLAAHGEADLTRRNAALSRHSVSSSSSSSSSSSVSIRANKNDHTNKEDDDMDHITHCNTDDINTITKSNTFHGTGEEGTMTSDLVGSFCPEQCPGQDRTADITAEDRTAVCYRARVGAQGTAGEPSGTLRLNSLLPQRALSTFIALCASAQLTIQGGRSSAESVALASLHALHGLLVEIPEQRLPAHGERAVRAVMAEMVQRRWEEQDGERGGGGDEDWDDPCGDEELGDDHHPCTNGVGGGGGGGGSNDHGKDDWACTEDDEDTDGGEEDCCWDGTDGCAAHRSTRRTHGNHSAPGTRAGGVGRGGQRVGAKAQCTQAVLSAVAAAMADVWVVQREQDDGAARRRAERADRTRRSVTGAGAAARRHRRRRAGTARCGKGRRLGQVTEVLLLCAQHDAVRLCYYHPNQVQRTVVDAVATMLPHCRGAAEASWLIRGAVLPLLPCAAEPVADDAPPLWSSARVGEAVCPAAPSSAASLAAVWWPYTHAAFVQLLLQLLGRLSWTAHADSARWLHVAADAVSGAGRVILLSLSEEEEEEALPAGLWRDAVRVIGVAGHDLLCCSAPPQPMQMHTETETQMQTVIEMPTQTQMHTPIQSHTHDDEEQSSPVRSGSARTASEHVQCGNGLYDATYAAHYTRLFRAVVTVCGRMQQLVDTAPHDSDADSVHDGEVGEVAAETTMHLTSRRTTLVGADSCSGQSGDGSSVQDDRIDGEGQRCMTVSEVAAALVRLTGGVVHHLYRWDAPETATLRAALDTLALSTVSVHAKVRHAGTQMLAVMTAPNMNEHTRENDVNEDDSILDCDVDVHVRNNNTAQVATLRDRSSKERWATLLRSRLWARDKSIMAHYCHEPGQRASGEALRRTLRALTRRWATCATEPMVRMEMRSLLRSMTMLVKHVGSDEANRDIRQVNAERQTRVLLAHALSAVHERLLGVERVDTVNERENG